MKNTMGNDLDLDYDLDYDYDVFPTNPFWAGHGVERNKTEYLTFLYI